MSASRSLPSGAEKEPPPPSSEPSAAFTPGPWRIGYEPDHYPRRSDRMLEICCLPHSTYDALDIFAPARGEDGHYDEPSLEEFDATARLIAAAPDLLEALRAILTEFGHRGGELDALLDPQPHALMRAAQAAIAKALGGAK